MKLNFYKSFLALVTAVFLYSACEKEYESIQEVDDKSIKQYLSENNITAKKNTQGIYFLSLSRGSGSAVQYNEQVPLVYTIKDLDNKFSSLDTFVNRYGGVGQFLGYLSPEGLRVAVKDSLKFRGGSMRIIIPSNLAYGRDGSGQIPGNASLEYTVRILNENDLPAYDQISIEKYKTAANLTGFSKTNTGIHYKIIEAGAGSSITKDSLLRVNYIGRLFNGKVFQQTSNNATTITLSETIQGWIQTLPLIKEGGTIRILLPSSYAYGSNGSKDQSGNFIIAPFSCLDFEVKVVEVQKDN